MSRDRPPKTITRSSTGVAVCPVMAGGFNGQLMRRGTKPRGSGAVLVRGVVGNAELAVEASACVTGSVVAEGVVASPVWPDSRVVVVSTEAVVVGVVVVAAVVVVAVVAVVVIGDVSSAVVVGGVMNEHVVLFQTSYPSGHVHEHTVSCSPHVPDAMSYSQSSSDTWVAFKDPPWMKRDVGVRKATWEWRGAGRGADGSRTCQDCVWHPAREGTERAHNERWQCERTREGKKTAKRRETQTAR